MPNSRDKITRTKRESTGYRKDRPKRRKQSFNPKNVEIDQRSFSASRQKISVDKVTVPEANGIEYRILNFIQVFTILSDFVKCKSCNGDIKFAPIETRGLGFKIAVMCDKCKQRDIPSCEYVMHSYEINTRFIFTMRMLGVGLAGCTKFCGLMDMPAFLSQSTYDIIIGHICDTVKVVFDIFTKLAVNEEKELSESENKNDFTVSGDGTWKKRGYTSLFGVASMIGYYSGKIIDIVVKSAYCKMCESWEKKLGTNEYEEWKTTHEPKCLANHSGSSGKMEVDAMQEMFERSEKLHGIKYVNYIGDGDSKTYSTLVKLFNYVIKKECIGHVQKRMGSRLRQLKKLIKGLGGKGKLTAKVVDKLTVYYGLAIRRYNHSVEAMKNAIWSTYFHYSSTNKKPQHEKCPVGIDSWCEWQRAYAALPEDKKAEIASFHHTYTALPADVLKAIKPIYEDLTKEELLERCVGGFTQNNNESYNQLIWKISPKHLPGSSVPVQIAAYTSACMFNEGNITLLKILEALGVQCGRNSHAYVTKQDESRITIAEQRAQAATKEGRMARRQQQIDILEAANDAEGLLYGPGIDDSM